MVVEGKDRTCRSGRDAEHHGTVGLQVWNDGCGRRLEGKVCQCEAWCQRA